MLNPTYFKTQQELRDWLEENHNSQKELYIGLYKKVAAHKGVGYRQALEEALCYGWIDGIRHSVDEESFCIRFTPRRPDSTWSAVNLKLMDELMKDGRVAPPGRKVFEERKPEKTNEYSFENRDKDMPEEYVEKIKANPKAWEYWQTRPPSYRKTAGWWVISAKQEMTRLKRLATLIEDSGNGRRIKLLRRKGE